MTKKKLILGLVIIVCILALLVTVAIVTRKDRNAPVDELTKKSDTTQTDVFEPIKPSEDTTEEIVPPSSNEEESNPTEEKNLSYDAAEKRKNPEPEEIGNSVEYETKE